MEVNMLFLVILMIFCVSVKAQLPTDCTGPWCPIHCPPGTYRYAVGCDYLQPEPTCKNPRPEKDMRGQICDYQACYCSPPTVRDEVNKQCVRLKDCPRLSVIPVTPRAPVSPRAPIPPRPPIMPQPKVPYIYADREW